MLKHSSSRQNEWITLGRFALAGTDGEGEAGGQGIEGQVQEAVKRLGLAPGVVQSLVSSLQGAARGIERRSREQAANASASAPASAAVCARILVSQQAIDLCSTVTTRIREDEASGQAFEEMKLAGSQGWGFFVIEHIGSAGGPEEQEPQAVLIDLYLYLEEGV